MKATVKQQMSESLPLGFLLMLAGGFLDAYSYLCRGEVFANAQTGNIVLLGISLAQGQWEKALQYFIPIGVFAFGILLAEKLRNSCQEKTNLHWRQVILLLEIVMLTLTVFLAAPGTGWPIASFPLSAPCRWRASGKSAATPMPLPCVLAICAVRQKPCTATSIPAIQHSARKA